MYVVRFDNGEFLNNKKNNSTPDINKAHIFRRRADAQWFVDNFRDLEEHTIHYRSMDPRAVNGFFNPLMNRKLLEQDHPFYFGAEVHEIRIQII